MAPQEINKIIQMVKRLNDGILIWIDSNYNNPEISFYLKLTSENKNLIIKCFHNVDDAFNFIFKKMNMLTKFVSELFSF